jgi:hypothetical protein
MRRCHLDANAARSHRPPATRRSPRCIATGDHTATRLARRPRRRWFHPPTTAPLIPPADHDAAEDTVGAEPTSRSHMNPPAAHTVATVYAGLETREKKWGAAGKWATS